jgi:hypothetical protein
LEETIVDQKLFITHQKQQPVFFQTTDKYDLQFDIFSAVFYLITRYEEYLLHEPDTHGRYKSTNSILSKKEFNFSPIVDVWLNTFKEDLWKMNPNLNFKNFEFEYIPTFDIDNAFKYLGRNWKHKPPNIFNKECRNVLLKKQPDPYDTFNFIFNEIDKYHLQPIFFFLLNDDSKSNSNVSPNSKLLHLKINACINFQLGIHPSYSSNLENNTAKEIKLLEEISHQPIMLSRQHFLKFKFPTTFLLLDSLNIKTDFSLAYPDIIGFRAGFSREIPFFNLKTNTPTNLIIQPTCWMDATYEYYQKDLDEDIIFQNFLDLYNLLKKNNGKLVTIFHNDLLTKDIYKRIFTKINNIAS